MPISESASRYETDLYLRVGEVLHYLWDPIGVRGCPEARDEYDRYVPQMCSLLKNGADAEQVALRLDEIATEQMGLNSNIERSRTTAQKLLDWRTVLLRKRPELLD